MTRAYAIVKRQRNPCSARRDHGHLGETSSVKVAGTGSLGRPGRAENPPAWVSAKWAPHRPTAGPETGRARRSVSGPPRRLEPAGRSTALDLTDGTGIASDHVARDARAGTAGGPAGEGTASWASARRARRRPASGRTARLRGPSGSRAGVRLSSGRA